MWAVSAIIANDIIDARHDEATAVARARVAAGRRRRERERAPDSPGPGRRVLARTLRQVGTMAGGVSSRANLVAVRLDGGVSGPLDCLG